MVASSVTGVGHGDSNGKYKPENNCGCGCPAQTSSSSSASRARKSCSVRHNVSSGVKIHNSASGGIRSNSCI